MMLSLVVGGVTAVLKCQHGCRNLKKIEVKFQMVEEVIKKMYRLRSMLKVMTRKLKNSVLKV